MHFAVGELNFELVRIEGELSQHCTHLAHDLEDFGLGHLDISTRAPSELELHRLCVRNARVFQVPINIHAHYLSSDKTSISKPSYNYVCVESAPARATTLWRARSW